ncbi:hypothetical protein [Secundilactobacillus silagei]|uniref:Uncharacterized protein n=1 Tax=Secundilactobacillus silagei JCM 19001 TaxID=1302250 RepID=A0A1Z5IFL1_9LACO|nr:hypothetical protein [Secundilactobacillus silagei]TDG71572.1 hypothetical protein C5L25_002229 [Secundilactobacillus silagei JCM 19001]GAX00439.1 hypothetical protein IWT126_00454 [Secundilactobacillus silagei JCM 19001]
MKKWIWTIVAVVIIAVIGGVTFTSHHITQKAYTAAMTTGRQAVSKENYSIAESAFQDALRHRTNDQQAQGHLTQTQNFVSAQSAMSDHEFSTAKSDYTKVKNAKSGSSMLRNRAKTALKLLKTVQLKAETFQDVYDQALTQNQGQSYEASNATLDRIFKDAAAKQSYYTNIYNHAVDLRSANNKAIKHGGDGTSDPSSSTPNSASSSADSSSANASSDSSSSSRTTGLTNSEKQAAKNYKGSNEFTVKKSQTEINGKAITAAQIASARKTLSAINVPAGSFSDQDIRTGLIAANKAGISFKAYAQKTYK